MATVWGVEDLSEKFNVHEICMLVKKIVRKRVTSSQKCKSKVKVRKKPSTGIQKWPYDRYISNSTFLSDELYWCLFLDVLHPILWAG